MSRFWRALYETSAFQDLLSTFEALSCKIKAFDGPRQRS
jgi:hypothetical protein